MVARLLAFVTLFAAVLAAGSGCQCARRVPPTSPAEGAGSAPATPAGAAEVQGSVVRPGPVTIPAGGLTLAAAIEQAGGVMPPGKSAAPVGLFAALSRADRDYYFAVPLIRDGAVGRVYLKPGDRVTVVDWTGTDLFRGRKLPVPPAALPPAPADPTDLGGLLTWSLDVRPELVNRTARLNQIRAAATEDEKAALMVNLFIDSTPAGFPKLGPMWFDKRAFGPAYVRALAEKVRPPAGTGAPTLPVDWEAVGASATEAEKAAWVRVLRVTVGGPEGPAQLSEVDRRVYFPNHPRLPGGQVMSLYGLATSVSVGPGSVAALRRTVNGRSAEFVLPMAVTDFGGVQGSSVFAQAVINDAIPFDGDVVEVTDPARLEVVMSSLIAPLIRPQGVPAAEREKAVCHLLGIPYPGKGEKPDGRKWPADPRTELGAAVRDAWDARRADGPRSARP